jgi:hypothetical protein
MIVEMESCEPRATFFILSLSDQHDLLSFIVSLFNLAIMLSLALFAASVSLVSAHGWLKDITIDGTEYPSFDPRIDIIFKSKRIDWGYSITNAAMNARGSGPVADVESPDIACRFNPLTPPAIHAVARAGSDIVFRWTDWFTNHKGPLFTVGCKSCPVRQLKADHMILILVSIWV